MNRAKHAAQPLLAAYIAGVRGKVHGVSTLSLIASMIFADFSSKGQLYSLRKIF